MRALKVLFAIALVAGVVAGVIYYLRRYPRETPPPQYVAEGQLRIYALNVGQGDGFLIISPEGKSVLIDAGPAGAGDDVAAALRKLKIGSLDLAVATHPHADHIGGMRQVIEKVEVKSFLDSSQVFASDEYERLLRTIKDNRINFVAARRGMKFDLDSGVKLEALNPQGNDQWITKVRPNGSVENANSVVLRLSYGDFSMLFTGDAEFETEALMMKSGAPLRAQVLKVGHHGSRHATSGKFLDAVNPEAAIISCGDDNKYGHPAQPTLDRLRRANVKVYRTDLSGEIAIITDGKKFDIRPTRQTTLAALWQGRIELIELP